MIVEFFDRQDEHNPDNGSIVRDEEQLSTILASLENRRPFFCELVAENGVNLLVGVGNIGCVQYSRRDGDIHLMAFAASAEATKADLEYLIGNTPTPVPPRYGLPFDVVKKVAAHFVRTSDRSTAVSWEEI